VLEVAERRQPGAEIVERELATQLFQCIDESIGLRITRDCCRLSDLETDLGRVDAAHLELIDNKRQELLVAKALTGKID